MATYTEVKAGLDDIAAKISGASKRFTQSQAQMLSSRNELAAIPTQFADILSTIDGFTPTGAAETFAQAEKAKLVADYVALKGSLETALDALGVSYT